MKAASSLLTCVATKALWLAIATCTACDASENGGSGVGEVPATDLRTDGVYQALQGDYSGYLRFYDDHTVITVSSSGTPADLASWFHKGQSQVSEGTWAIVGTTIQFTARSSAGSVEYQGDVGENQLILHVHSFINGYQHTEAYQFEPVTFVY